MKQYKKIQTLLNAQIKANSVCYMFLSFFEKWHCQ